VTFPIDNRPGPTVLGSPVNAASTRIETLPPLACLHCAATQATVRRDRQIADALLGYPTECVCCTRKPATPAPGSQNLAYGSYDCGYDSETGYADAGERYRCLDCGSTGDVDDAAPALAMLAQEPRKPMTIAHSAAELPDVA
jgi:hypothetical protein